MSRDVTITSRASQAPEHLSPTQATATGSWSGRRREAEFWQSTTHLAGLQGLELILPTATSFTYTIGLGAELKLNSHSQALKTLGLGSGSPKPHLVHSCYGADLIIFRVVRDELHIAHVS